MSDPPPSAPLSPREAPFPAEAVDRLARTLKRARAEGESRGVTRDVLLVVDRLVRDLGRGTRLAQFAKPGTMIHAIAWSRAEFVAASAQQLAPALGPRREDIEAAAAAVLAGD